VRNAMEEGDVEKTLIHCWWYCKLVQSLWISVWRFLKYLKLELSYDPTTHAWACVQGMQDNIEILSRPCLWQHYSQ
jgi:hypothetical protein